MRAVDVIASAVANTFRAKTRTALTVLAIVVGAFTLTITTGLGTGINRYIDDTVASIGADDVMTVTKQAEAATTDGPTVYDPDRTTSSLGGAPGQNLVERMGPDDLDALAAIDGVERVSPVHPVSADFVRVGDGTAYEATVGSFIPGMRPQLAAGAQPDAGSSQPQVAIPVSYVEPLGFDDADAAIGATATIAVTDAEGVQTTVDATIVAVAEDSFGAGGSSLTPNDALDDALVAAQSVGLTEAQRGAFTQATVWFDADATEAEVDALQQRLDDAGYTGTTVADQLGTFTSIIDGIVLVLNAFAVIALLAASFGIVNTLLMSVQDRTREIGLMKAMGMPSGRVFGLFSTEATTIGFLGSAIGAGAGMLVGTGVSRALAGGLFADLPGLTLIAFDPVSIATIILVVMAVAFLAGTIPAARAARQDPIESLRYE